jgi:hypothetical protein
VIKNENVMQKKKREKGRSYLEKCGGVAVRLGVELLL